MLSIADFFIEKDKLIFIMEDKAGALYDILQALEAANVNIEYMYAYTGEVTGSANVVFRVDDIEGAEAQLKEAGVEVL